MCLHTYIHIRKHVFYKIWTTCITGAYIICIITRKTKYISKIRYKIGWIYLNSYFIYSVHCILYISYMIHIIYELKHIIVHRINHCIYHLICECTKYIMSYKCHFCMYIYIYTHVYSTSVILYTCYIMLYICKYYTYVYHTHVCIYIWSYTYIYITGVVIISISIIIICVQAVILAEIHFPVVQ
jgi:hypothetical protein